MTKTEPVVVCVGPAASGAGYPNARNTLRILRALPGMTVVDRANWLPEGFRLWKLGGGAILPRLGIAAMLLWYGLLGALRTLVSARGAIVYVPYPAIFTLWWLSWTPRRIRPVVVADAYVLVWDAMVSDRNPRAASSLASRVLRWVETRALCSAAWVLVDTEANKRVLRERLGPAPVHIVAAPLAIDACEHGHGANPSGATARPSRDHALKVLFFGTLVPLHGARVLADAIRLLGGQPIRFELVGDGQDARHFESLLEDVGTDGVQWIRDWQSPAQVRQRLSACDVCLGVFGGDGKASHVLPLKVYHALACGKPVVTQRSYSMPEGCPAPPMILCDPDAESLAEALRSLERDRALLEGIGWNARGYYEEFLSDNAVLRVWQGIIAASP